MIIKISELLNFPAFYAVAKSTKLPLKTSYKLSKLNAAIDTELEFYRTKLQEIVGEFGEKDENGNPIPTEDGQGIKLKPGCEQDCLVRISELAAIEVNLPDLIFSLDDFGTLELSPDEMAAILPFIAE